MALKTGKQTIFVVNISAIYEDLNIILPNIYETSSYIMGSCEMTNLERIIECVRNVDGIVDFIIVDEEKKKKDLYNILNEVRENAKKSTVLTYKGNRTWIQAIDNMVSCLWGDLIKVNIGIVGINDVSIKLGISLTERGANVKIFNDNNKKDVLRSANSIKLSNSPFEIQYIINTEEFSKNLDILIGLDRTIKIDIEMIKNMNKKGIIIDAIFDSIKIDALEYAQEKNISIFRVDEKAAMAGEMTTVLRTYSMMIDTGDSYIGDIHVITPTCIGKKGDIIVDSILNPKEIIGVADGKGKLLQNTENYQDIIRKVELEIIKRIMIGKPYGDG